MLRLADVDLDFFRLGALADDHAGVNLLARADKERSSLLRGEQTVSDCFAVFKCDQGPVLSECDVTLVRCVRVKDRIHDACTLGRRQEIAVDSDQAARGDQELKSNRTVGECGHSAKFALPFGQHADHGA